MAGSRPQKGDVVVRERRRDDVMFALTVWGSSGEMTCVRFLDVLTMAKRTAEPNNAAIWFTDDDVRFNLLCTFR